MKKLSINQKLMVMLIIPAFAVTFFAGIAIADRVSMTREMTELEELTQVALAITNLVQELQVERGLTALYLASEGKEFTSELTSQRAVTDRARVEVESTVYAVQLDRFPAVRESYQEVLQKLSELPARREGVSRQEVTVGQGVDYYTATNADAIAMVSSLTGVISNSSLSQQLSAFVALMLEKEYAGLERASLNGAFAADRFVSDDHYLQFVGTVARQDAFQAYFEMSADTENMEQVRSAKASVTGEHRRMRAIAFARAAEGEFGVDAADWFRASSAYISALHVGEHQMIGSIARRAQQLRSDAQRALYIFIAVALANLLVALGIAQVIASSISKPLNTTSAAAQAIAQQIVATATQQNASVTETASSVSQTSTTVDELRQTSKIAAERSNAVRTKSEKSVAASDEALTAISQGIDAMNRIRQEVEGIAQNILELSEKNIQIGEIVQSVNAIAEQSNLLAVNASIEAAQAGEHGKGFSVVASEVKALAAQSKDATAQIRGILSEIQKSSNAAVMVTEQGTKRVEESNSLIEGLGLIIRELGESIEDSLEASIQIATTARQQLSGIEEITIAIGSIEQATRENAVGTRQLEHAAQQVKAISDELSLIVGGRRAA